jgi:hypothetical protein
MSKWGRHRIVEALKFAELKNSPLLIADEHFQATQQRRSSPTMGLLLLLLLLCVVLRPA